MADTSFPFSAGSGNDPFLMGIEDIFTIKGRGIIVTGRVEHGSVNVGASVEVVGMKEQTRQIVIKGIEMFRKQLPSAHAGDAVGCLVGEMKHPDFERGQVLASIGSIKAVKKFNAQIEMYEKEQGGRHTPFFSGYRPSFYIRSVDISGSIELPGGLEMVMPGQRIETEVQLLVPVAMEVGTKFALREGGRTVGTGTCTGVGGSWGGYPY